MEGNLIQRFGSNIMFANKGTFYRCHAISTIFPTFLSFLYYSSFLYFEGVLRGCLAKNHPLNLAEKIILPETLATERLYQD